MIDRSLRGNAIEFQQNLFCRKLSPKQYNRGEALSAVSVRYEVHTPRLDTQADSLSGIENL